MNEDSQQERLVFSHSYQIPRQVWAIFFLVFLVVFVLGVLIMRGHWLSALLGTLIGLGVPGGAQMYDYAKRCWWVTETSLIAGVPKHPWVYRWRVALTDIESVEVVEKGATRLNRQLRPRGGGNLIKPWLRTHVVVTLSKRGKYGDLMILSTPRAEEFSDELIAAIKAAGRNAPQQDGGTV